MAADHEIQRAAQKLNTSALKAAGIVGAVTKWFVIAIAAAAEAERFFLCNNAAVWKCDFSLGALYFSRTIGNDCNF